MWIPLHPCCVWSSILPYSCCSSRRLSQEGVLIVPYHCLGASGSFLRVGLSPVLYNGCWSWLPLAEGDAGRGLSAGRLFDGRGGRVRAFWAVYGRRVLWVFLWRLAGLHRLAWDWLLSCGRVGSVRGSLVWLVGGGQRVCDYDGPCYKYRSP